MSHKACKNAASILALVCSCCAAASINNPAFADAAAPDQAASSSGIETVIVTAQKREENIQNVGMSIQAVSGDKLTDLGIKNTNDLVKVVPGFEATPSIFGAPIYTIRGIGYQDGSLAASPTVSIYNDQVPLPFSIVSIGSTLDLQRVEVLKGPQGTLFGENATGGAINYIANKPTDSLEAGADLSYGRFNQIDAQGYISGPLTDNLTARLALRTQQSDGWQQSITRDATLGSQDITSGRLSFLWTPTSRLTVLATFSGFVDRSETPAPQFYGISILNGVSALPPGLLAYPIAPHNDRTADWSPCINDSPTNTHCVGYRRNNKSYIGSVRADYDLGNDIVLTSLTAYEHYTQYQPTDGDGTSYQDFDILDTGHLSTFFQELRLSGNFSGEGSWVAGVNFQHDDTAQSAFDSFSESSTHLLYGFFPVIGLNVTIADKTNTSAVFGHADYPLTDRLIVEGGVRFTQSDQHFAGCERDNGNGVLAAALNFVLGSSIPPGGCVTLGPTFVPELVHDKLDENNLSWRVGLNYKLADDVLLYANASQGYKAGAFSGLTASSYSQFSPAKQEKLIAYEAGFKSTLLDDTLQLNGAAFYYDYSDKQIQGSILDPVFGALPKLINIPRSHVAGFELSAIWKPVAGLTFSPTVSYNQSRIDGNFSTYNDLGVLQNVTGQAFPDDPKIQGDIDAQYEWGLTDDLNAFVGINANYQGPFDESAGNSAENIKGYTLLDVRAGLTRDAWRLQFWGRNITDQFGVVTKLHVNDVYARWTVMPATYGFTLSYQFK